MSAPACESLHLWVLGFASGESRVTECIGPRGLEGPQSPPGHQEHLYIPFKIAEMRKTSPKWPPSPFYVTTHESELLEGIKSR